jgi:DNA repair exonuclease SbcCD ATPase subunit
MAGDIDNLRLDIGLLKKDVEIFTTIFNKLDVTIDKLQELSSNMTKMITVHEHRLEYQEKMDQELAKLIEQRRSEFQMDIKELHSRITTVTRELTDKIEESEKGIRDEIKSLRDCITQREVEKNKGILDRFQSRLQTIESWKWKLTGAIIVLVWFSDSFLVPYVKKISKLFN